MEAMIIHAMPVTDTPGMRTARSGSIFPGWGYADQCNCHRRAACPPRRCTGSRNSAHQCARGRSHRASGHKVLTLPQHEGKLCAEEVEAYIADFYRDETYEHMVAPGMVYISHPTEYGTLYSLSELEALSRVCRKANIPLYMDGARLGYGLAAPGTDVTLQDIARLCDVFYIGGTKVGALFGEAVVAPHAERLPHFFPLIKQHGALLAKGRLLGIQFETLFTDGLYLEMGKHAVRLAQKLEQEVLSKKGINFIWIRQPTSSLSACLTRISTAFRHMQPSSYGDHAEKRKRWYAS